MATGFIMVRVADALTQTIDVSGATATELDRDRTRSGHVLLRGDGFDEQQARKAHPSDTASKTI